MIREVKREEIPECVDLIKKAFSTVAEEFGQCCSLTGLSA